MDTKYVKFDKDLWRGPKPSTKDDLLPFGRVVNLQSETVEAPYVWQEKAWCDELGIKFHHIAMSLVTPPTFDQLLDAYAMLLKPDSPTLVHCAQGVDRTGLVVAFWQVRVKGRSPGEALGEAFEMGFHLDRYCWWLPSAYEHLSKAFGK